MPELQSVFVIKRSSLAMSQYNNTNINIQVRYGPFEVKCICLKGCTDTLVCHTVNFAAAHEHLEAKLRCWFKMFSFFNFSNHHIL